MNEKTMNELYRPIIQGLIEVMPNVRFVSTNGLELRIGKVIGDFSYLTLEERVNDPEAYIHIHITKGIPFGGRPTKELGKALGAVLLSLIPNADMSIPKNLIVGYRFSEYDEASWLRFGYGYEKKPEEQLICPEPQSGD